MPHESGPSVGTGMVRERAGYAHVRQWYHDDCKRRRDSIPNVVPVDLVFVPNH